MTFSEKVETFKVSFDLIYGGTWRVADCEEEDGSVVEMCRKMRKHLIKF